MYLLYEENTVTFLSIISMNGIVLKGRGMCKYVTVMVMLVNRCCFCGASVHTVAVKMMLQKEVVRIACETSRGNKMLCYQIWFAALPQPEWCPLFAEI